MSAARKRKLVIGLSVMLLAALVIGMTYAYFTDTETKTNTFTVGDLDITLEEEWKPDDGKDIVPGDSVEKEPKVIATKGDSYMRVVMSIVDKDGNAITDATRLSKILSTLFYDSGSTIKAGDKYSSSTIGGWPGATVMNPYNKTDFELGTSSGGVYTYYYKNTTTSDVFKQGAEAILFNRVVIPTDWKQADMWLLNGTTTKVVDGKTVVVPGTGYQIVIRAEAIQSEGFADRAAAFTALDAELNP